MINVIKTFGKNGLWYADEVTVRIILHTFGKGSVLNLFMQSSAVTRPGGLSFTFTATPLQRRNFESCFRSKAVLGVKFH